MRPAPGRVGFVGILAWLSLVAAGCTNATPGGSGAPTATPHASGTPLRLALAHSIDQRGAPVGASLTFLPTDQQVVAIVPVGAVAGATALTVAWSSLDATGAPTKLFEQHIPTASFRNAFSTATAASGLRSGVYQLDATLGNRHGSLMWVVKSTSSGQGGAVPGPGPSGAIDPFPASNAPATPATGCRVNLAIQVIAVTLETNLTANGSGCGAMQVSAADTGSPDLVIGMGGQPECSGCERRLDTSTDVCALPGHSDAPGTMIRITGQEVRHPEGKQAQVLGLTDAGAIAATIVGQPPEGKKVANKQTIGLSVIVGALAPTSGFAAVRVISNTGQTQTVLPTPDSPCSAGRGAQTFTVSFAVPDNPPPLYQLTADVSDAAGHTQTTAVQYPTGDVWNGTEHITGSRGPGCTVTVDAVFQVVVAAGQLSGRLSGSINDVSTGCKPSGPNFKGMRIGLVQGSLSSGRFVLSLVLSGDALNSLRNIAVPLASPTSATASGTNSLAGGATQNYSLSLQCATC